jgi:hypothetical protein
MTYGDFKRRLARRLVHNQLSPVALDESLNSDFSDAAIEYLKDFCRSTDSIYVTLAALALAEDDQKIDLSQAVSGYKIYEPWEVYVNGTKRDRVNLFDINDENQASVSPGTPTSWAKVGFYQIIFNIPCSSGLTNNYVTGMADHPDISTDEQQLELSDYDIPAALDYVAAEFASDAASDELGLIIADRFRKRADKGVTMIKARNLAQRLHSINR